MKFHSPVKRSILFACLVLTLIFLSACAASVTWVDADGTVLESIVPTKNQEIPTRDLPSDDDTWHYTGWSESTKFGKTTYTAERIEKTRVLWKDADGTVLSTDSVIPGETPDIFPLPLDTAEWLYTGWKEESTSDGEIVYTAERTPKTVVSWYDADGTLLHRESIHPSARIPSRDLPANSENGIYIEWRRTDGEHTVDFTAQRIPAKTVIWTDADGATVETRYLSVYDPIPDRPLPASQKWVYDEWEKSVSGDVVTFTAKGTPNPAYFAGNVFQIVGKDLLGNPMMYGTGFVFNNMGWFITNYHVLEGCYTADGVFEIKNFANGSAYTTLTIEKISYADRQKDILIGKLENYNSISTYYKNIPVQLKYETGDVTYSVGYPNATDTVAIHQGKVLKSFSSLADKLYSGIQYISSDSYVAHGSSGGILVNDKLELLGMTTLGLEEGNDGFVLGASIEAFNYHGLFISKNKSSMLKDLGVVMHPDEEAYIRFVKNLRKDKNTTVETEDGVQYLKNVTTINSSGGYEETYTVTVLPLGYVTVEHEIYWGDDDFLGELIYGNLYEGLDSFYYLFTYEWPDGQGYVVYSENINYSPTLSSTLLYYQTEMVGGYQPSIDNINYAKKFFNDLYVYVRDLIS